MAKKSKSKSGAWKAGRSSLSASYADDPQTVRLAGSFIKSPQRFLEYVQELRGKIQSQLEWSSGGWKWNPPEPFNYATFVGDAGRCCEAFHAARYENSKLANFDGEVFRSLVRRFDRMTLEPNVPDDLICNFQRFKDEVDRLKLRLSVNEWAPTEAQIQKVKDAIAGMKFKTTNLDAIQKAVRMNRQRVSIILKLIGHNAE